MTNPVITFDTDNFVRFLDDTKRRQVPFALANALNATANDMQQAIRNRLQGGRGFVIRSEGSRRFLLRQIRRNPGEDFATKRRLVARVRIANNRKASLLSLIDQGGERSTQFAIAPATQGRDLAIPQRPSPTARIPRSLYPAKLNLRQTAKGSGLRGDRRTFTVRTKAGDLLLLQRKGRRTVRTLFVLERSATMRPRNFFAPAAEGAATTRFAGNLERAFAHALRTAR